MQCNLFTLQKKYKINLYFTLHDTNLIFIFPCILKTCLRHNLYIIIDNLLPAIDFVFK